MQESFEFFGAEIAQWREPLALRFGRLVDVPRRRPLGQLVKSLISSRTKDAVSLGAYRRLGRRWSRAGDMAKVPPYLIERTIFDVTFAEKKAVYLPASLRLIHAEHPDFALEFLAGLPVDEALAILERLPGVGRKVAAATLNASTLRMRVFIVDSHVHRVLIRIGFIGERATPRAASELVTASAVAFSADDLLELFLQMKLLGQTVCRFDAPNCSLCPLASCCRMAKTMDVHRPCS